jgi:hypothetical protein
MGYPLQKVWHERFTGAVTAILLIPVQAWAQQPADLPNEDKGIVQWLIALGIVALICGAAFLNPKRSHLS